MSHNASSSIPELFKTVLKPYSYCNNSCLNVGVASSGYGQAVVTLKPGNHLYYTTVRGVTNNGNVLETITDGFTVDTSPPVINLER